MERRTFINDCGRLCLGIPLVQIACSPVKYFDAIIENRKIKVPKTQFLTSDGKKYRHFILLQAKGLNYPIVVYRSRDAKFHSLLLRCTHQGTELEVNGRTISCPAHGSEYDDSGKVIQGPAPENLRSFKTSEDDQNVYIEL